MYRAFSYRPTSVIYISDVARQGRDISADKRLPGGIAFGSKWSWRWDWESCELQHCCSSKFFTFVIHSAFGCEWYQQNIRLARLLLSRQVLTGLTAGSQLKRKSALGSVSLPCAFLWRVLESVRKSSRESTCWNCSVPTFWWHDRKLRVVVASLKHSTNVQLRTTKTKQTTHAKIVANRCQHLKGNFNSGKSVRCDFCTTCFASHLPAGGRLLVGFRLLVQAEKRCFGWFSSCIQLTSLGKEPCRTVK